jgi:hypothetical protein
LAEEEWVDYPIDPNNREDGLSGSNFEVLDYGLPQCDDKSTLHFMRWPKNDFEIDSDFMIIPDGFGNNILYDASDGHTKYETFCLDRGFAQANNQNVSKIASSVKTARRGRWPLRDKRPLPSGVVCRSSGAHRHTTVFEAAAKKLKILLKY